MKHVFRALVGVAVLVANAAACAGVEEGMRAFARDDLGRARQEFSVAARHGQAEAQFYLGYLFDHGYGVPVNQAEAARWYLKAALQGDADGQNALGQACADGAGVPQDYDRAAQWLRAAAEQGHAEAQYRLGMLYERGQGVARNPARAHLLFDLAARSGDPARLHRTLTLIEQQQARAGRQHTIAPLPFSADEGVLAVNPLLF